MKESFIIDGLAGRCALSGAIRVNGAKNEALKLMAASVLFKTPVTFTNMPPIEDVARMAEILEKLGGTVRRSEDACTLDTAGLAHGTMDRELSRRLRSSVVLTGPLLARFGTVAFPHPGGDLIGERPIDFFVSGFEKMGATVETAGDTYHVRAPEGLHGADIFFPWVSVTATETLLMAALLAKGKTVLRNVALEPEVIDLASFLAKCGARIEGIGTSTLTVEGGALLSAEGAHPVIPDRIETGSFLILAALAGKDVRIEACEPEHVRMLIELLGRSGVSITAEHDALTVQNGAGDARRAMMLKTHEYPGFPTDLQAPMLVYLTQAAGESRIFETVFEGRLSYTEDLVRMGAKITVWNPHQATVTGPTPLRGAVLESPDIRAGLAYLIAALIAEGTSTLENIYHIDRGYARIEERLGALGAGIRRARG